MPSKLVKSLVRHDEAKENFIRQLKRLGLVLTGRKRSRRPIQNIIAGRSGFSRFLQAHDPSVSKESAQWWCETDNTVLASEQVEGGKCWRCGNPVTKKNLKQWFFRITAYADEMLEATDDLDWTEMVKTMQEKLDWS